MSFVGLTSADVEELIEKFHRFHQRFSRFFQTATRSVAEHAGKYLHGQLICLERANMTRLEKLVPEANHQALHHFVSKSPWKDEPVIEAIQERVEQLIGDGDEGAIHLDESGFVKQGDQSVGVAWQYCGRLGKVANCQVGVFLGYTKGDYRTVIDRRLYLPQEWANDEQRRNKAGVPKEVVYEPKADLGLEMLRDAQRRGVPFGFVGMDSFYGQQPKLLGQLEGDGIVYIADIPCDTRVWLSPPAVGIPARQGNRGPHPSKQRVVAGEPEPVEVRKIVRELPAQEWQRQYIRETTRGQLYSEVACLRVYPVRDELPGPESWLVLRRTEGEGTIKYQLSNAPLNTSRERLSQMSHSRYWMERALEDAKGEAGMADYELRGWRGWHHHMTMTLLAMLFLLEVQLEWQPKAPMLTVQDVREILEVILPKRQISHAEILSLIEQKHKARASARQSHARHYHNRPRRM